MRKLCLERSSYSRWGNLVSKDLIVPITFRFCWRGIATCKTNMKNMEVTSFTAKKTWSLSLKVTDQAVVPVVTLGLLVLFSRSLLTHPFWSWAAGWLTTTANWTRSKHLNRDDSIRVFVQRLWNWHLDTRYVFVEELRGYEMLRLRWPFELRSRKGLLEREKRKCSKYTDTWVSGCGVVWNMEEGKEERMRDCYVTNNF